MTDYGFAPLPGSGPNDPANQYDRLRRLFDKRRSGTELVHKPPATTIQEFIQLLENSSTVVRPIDFALLGTHANRVGMEIPLYRGQPSVFSNLSDYEAADAAATDPTMPVTFPAALLNPDLPNYIHIKGCNMGQSEGLLQKLKEAFGSHVQVTAPKHYHGIADMHYGIFEFMAYEFRVSRPTDFNNRAEAIQAFRDAAALPNSDPKKLKFYDGTNIPPDRWEAWIPQRIRNSQRIVFPPFTLGAQIDLVRTLDVSAAMRFRVDRTPFRWTITYSNNHFPTDHNQALVEYFENLPVFQDSHDFPMFIRYGYESFQDFIDGYNWQFTKVPVKNDPSKSMLIAVGGRTVYTAQIPITDTVTGNLVFNFFPNPSSQLPPVVRLVENDHEFFTTV